MLLPLDMRLQLCRSDIADEKMSGRDDLERLDARTVRRISNNPLDILS